MSFAGWQQMVFKFWQFGLQLPSDSTADGASQEEPGQWADSVGRIAAQHLFQVNTADGGAR